MDIAERRATDMEVEVERGGHEESDREGGRLQKQSERSRGRASLISSLVLTLVLWLLAIPHSPQIR